MSAPLRRGDPPALYAAVLRVLALLLALLAASPARAAESEAVRSPRATVSLITELAEIRPGERFAAGLLLRLAPGWHTYWRNPGDAGAPAEITFTLPPGANATGFDWPAPQRLAQGPLVSFGFTGEVLLPLFITPPASLAPGDRLRLEADATWLVCAEICVPEEGRFRLDLPVSPSGALDPAQAARFARARAALPQPAGWSAEASLGPGKGRLVLAGEMPATGTVQQAFFFPTEQGLIDSAALQPLHLAPKRLTLDLTRPADAATASRLEGVLVLTDQGGARAAYTIAAPVSALAGGSPEAPLPLLLLSALLGGLLLNLMPCVFPVLAMKAMAMARLGGAGAAAVRAEAAAYTLGVLTSMLALAGAILAMRGAGQAIGWGFQLTAPSFVAVLCWLMLGVALNLSGVFRLGAALGIGGDLAARGGALGSFATGALAVLVATPCTAPFMAAAIGAAFSLPPAATLAIFAALGLGLALPYGLLGVFPGVARRLPRPGAWMEWLRQALAFPMYAAAAWLAWVLAQQSGPDGLGLLLIGAVLIGFAAWAARLGEAGVGAGRWLAGAALVAALALLPILARSPPPATLAPTAAETWSAERVAALQAAGKPVFVNLTAAWCITCKLNERLVLRTEAVQAAFARHGVATLTGDWTQGDPAIGALLRENGREGVPLYLLYPAGGGSPQLLPQVLTEGVIRRAIGEAG
jgi:thiol:disulfide interchange protein DsbD